jgi:hypothetical protein
VACDAPPRECLAWHVLPRLSHGKLYSDGENARGLCPAHDDRDPSFSISIGDNQRLMWRCFAGCQRPRIRAALIAIGVPAGCLPLVAREKEELVDILRLILTADSADHAGIRLRAMAALEGYSDLPKGGELERIAGLVHVNRVTAYRAKKAAPPSTHNTSSYSSSEKLVKPRRSQPPGEVA